MPRSSEWRPAPGGTESSSRDPEIERLFKHSEYLLQLSVDAHRRAMAASAKLAEAVMASKLLLKEVQRRK